MLRDGERTNLNLSYSHTHTHTITYKQQSGEEETDKKGL